MKLKALHHRIASLADALQEQHTVIAGNHPKDQEGFLRPSDPDLADALRAMSDAVACCLALRTSYHKKASPMIETERRRHPAQNEKE